MKTPYEMLGTVCIGQSPWKVAPEKDASAQCSDAQNDAKFAADDKRLRKKDEQFKRGLNKNSDASSEKNASWSYVNNLS